MITQSIKYSNLISLTRKNKKVTVLGNKASSKSYIYCAILKKKKSKKPGKNSARNGCQIPTLRLGMFMFNYYLLLR